MFKKKTSLYCNYLVAFVDILGQKESFIPTKVITRVQTREDMEANREAHRNTILYIRNFRKNFNLYCKHVRSKFSVTRKVPLKKLPAFLKIRKTIIKQSYFSDSFIAYVPLYQSSYHSTSMNGICDILAFFGFWHFVSMSIFHKVLRGGIDLGSGVELDKNEIYGHALFQAYELESKRADYPRILIGEEAIRYLFSLKARTQQFDGQKKEDIDYCQRMAEKCLRWIANDQDGLNILDYLSPAFKEDILMKIPEIGDRFQSLFISAYNFCKTELDKFNGRGNQKLSSRYQKLIAYFLSSAKRNGIAPNIQ